MKIKIYVVTEWNGESYEDSYEWVDKVFKRQEDAKKYVDDKTKSEQKRKVEPLWEKHEWSIKEHNLIEKVDE